MNQAVKRAIRRESGKLSGEKRSEYYNFGFEYFGPFLYGFTSWLKQRLTEEGLTNVYFFSRDGYMMQKAFHLLAPEFPNTQYVCFSRKSLRQSLLWKCDDFQASLRYLTYENFISVGRLLDYYGFGEAERERIAKEYGWDLAEDLPWATLSDNRKAETVYDTLKEDILRKSKEQYELLTSYLDSIRMEGSCAIVDIGWIGSMQYALEQFAAFSGRDLRVHGFYVGMNPENPVTGPAEGWLYNKDDLALRKSLLCFFGGLEKLFQSLEGSTDGYTWKDGTAVPVLAPYEYEGDAPVQAAIKDWQQGALDFMEGVQKDPDAAEAAALRDWAEPLVAFGKSPPLKGVKLFSFFYNVDGTKQYFVAQKPLWKYAPKELAHDLSNSVWKTGFMKSVLKVPFPYFKVYDLLRK